MPRVTRGSRALSRGSGGGARSLSRRESLKTLLPKNFLHPCILLLLREEPVHGYALLERLKCFGFGRSDPGRLYRALRTLEEEGLVRADWEESEGGPHRRIYEITRAGMEKLHEQAKGVVQARGTLDGFLSRYEEFVALRRARYPALDEGEPATDGESTVAEGEPAVEGGAPPVDEREPAVDEGEPAVDDERAVVDEPAVDEREPAVNS